MVNDVNLSMRINDALTKFYGASRLLLLPALTGLRTINCGLLSVFCCGDGLLTVNYRVGDRLTVVKAMLGSLTRDEVPCSIDARRMPPLKPFVDLNVVGISDGKLVVNRWPDYERAVKGSSVAYDTYLVARALTNCRALNVSGIARCLGLEAIEAFKALLTLRLLYPALLELILPDGVTVNDVLRGLSAGASLTMSDLVKLITARGLKEKGSGWNGVEREGGEA